MSPMSAVYNEQAHARSEWPPVVVASVSQTGLNLMRDLIRRGLRVVGVDCDLEAPGFQSVYGKSYLCPNPDSHPKEWLAFMRNLSEQLGTKPVLISAADIFVSAVGRHAEALDAHYLFSPLASAIQAAFATKEQQYALADRYGFPCPLTSYVQSAEELRKFADVAQFPCILKPRHHREWEALPQGLPMSEKKLIVAHAREELLGYYSMAEPYQPRVMAQEIVVGPDNAKYCYLSVYGRNGLRLGYCVVKEYRCQPALFGSASVVGPVIDREIAELCDAFLQKVHYVGLCEIEVKRDLRNGKVMLIEVNPRFSVTADCARYTGVELGFIHYLDLIGEQPSPVEPTRFEFLHICLRRECAAAPVYLESGLATWKDLLQSYRQPLEYYDWDWRDWRVTARTLYECAKRIAVAIARRLLRKAKYSV